MCTKKKFFIFLSIALLGAIQPMYNYYRDEPFRNDGIKFIHHDVFTSLEVAKKLPNLIVEQKLSMDYHTIADQKYLAMTEQCRSNGHELIIQTSIIRGKNEWALSSLAVQKDGKWEMLFDSNKWK